MSLFGPFRTPSLGKKSYVYVIVDDFSRYTCVMFEFQVFSKFCKKVQNEKDFSITCIRSDHRREFDNIDFEIYYNEHGIDHNFSVPRTLQQNEQLKGKIELHKK